MEVILDDDVDLGAETTLAAKVDTQEGGMIKIRNEESISAFNIDINSLKTKDWKMDGDESDYFNYGFNEYMWKVSLDLHHFCVGLCSLCEKSTRSSRCQETRGIQLHSGRAGSQRSDFANLSNLRCPILRVQALTTLVQWIRRRFYTQRAWASRWAMIRAARVSTAVIVALRCLL